MKARVQFGSKNGNRFLRAFQIGMPLLLLTLFGLPFTLFSWICSVSCFVIAEIYVSAMVFCIADETGLHIQRWSRWKHVSWQELLPLNRQPLAFYKVVAIRNRPLWSRYLLLPGAASLHELEIKSEKDRAIRDLLQDGVTGRTN